MSKVTVETAPGISAWSYEEELSLPGGRHEVDVTNKRELREALAAAVAAGVLVLVDGSLPDGVVEDDEVSLEKQAVALEARAQLLPERDAELATASSADEFNAMVEAWEERLGEAATNALGG